MSKVTIKFWDSINNEYSNTCYYLDDDMIVYCFEDSGFENYMYEVRHVEPHFYKDGERIA